MSWRERRKWGRRRGSCCFLEGRKKVKQVCSLTSFSFTERERENSLFAKGTELHSRVLSRANAMYRPLCSVRSGVGGVSVLRRRRAGEQTRELTTMAPLPSPRLRHRSSRLLPPSSSRGRDSSSEEENITLLDESRDLLRRFWKVIGTEGETEVERREGARFRREQRRRRKNTSTQTVRNRKSEIEREKKLSRPGASSTRTRSPCSSTPGSPPGTAEAAAAAAAAAAKRSKKKK